MGRLSVTLSVWFTIDDVPASADDYQTPAECLERALRRMSPEGRIEYLRHATQGTEDGSAVHVAPVLDALTPTPRLREAIQHIVEVGKPPMPATNNTNVSDTHSLHNAATQLTTTEAQGVSTVEEPRGLGVQRTANVEDTAPDMITLYRCTTPGWRKHYQCPRCGALHMCLTDVP